MKENISLDIYKASAGSGKTFTLTAEYISYLIENPESYRHILAVTFTNRATEEMKHRILSALYGISHHLPEMKDYVKRLQEILFLRTHGRDFDEQMIAERASTALFNLLHHYSDFRIETIDSFFQSIFRNLARELNLTANLRIDLNDKQVEHQAVDQLIEELEAKDEVLTWLMEYITENIDDNKNWNVIASIKSFGNNIFKDFYKEHADRLRTINDSGLFNKFKKQLWSIRDEAKKEMVSIADAFFEDLSAHGIEADDLWYKEEGPIVYFKKLRNGYFENDILGKRVQTVLEDHRKWASKDSKKASLVMERAEVLWNPLVMKAERLRPTRYELFQSAQLTLRHLNQLRLLGHIEKRVNLLNEEANRFLLSNTQNLLSLLIQNEDSPFIFEKIGTTLKHIMIDEFQDTSTIQWRNFKILLAECMSHGDRNLIVGDVKQSIYRWRSGDWKLLNNIDLEFPEAKHQLKIESLDTNYRSEKKIIAFNNLFFKQAVAFEKRCLDEEGVTDSEMYARAYNDVGQQLPQWRAGNNNGYVHIELLPKEEYSDLVLKKVTDQVRELIYEKGFKSKDIAILVRTNKNIPLIANHFMENLPEVKIVSDEAFKLSASIAVNILINALKVLNNPEDILTKATLVKSYQKEVLQTSLSDSTMFVEGKTLSDFLPKEFETQYMQLTAMPLFDLMEKLYRIFQLERLDGQSIYVATLYDILSDYLCEQTPDINRFLKEWESIYSEKTIQGNEIDGIRLISIHKSKGLEFAHVIIPFCDWKLEQQETIWCKPDKEPFSMLPVIPINYSSKKMIGTIYEKDYWQEHLQNTVDNMNLLYVAFTRAKKSLTVFGKRDNRQSRSQIIQETLPKIIDDLGQEVFFQDEGKNNHIVFTYGTLEKSEQRQNEKAEKSSENIFLTTPKPIEIAIRSYNTKVEFLQSNKSQMFLQNDSDKTTRQEGFIKAGNILHQIFSRIHTIDDINIVLNQLKKDGILYHKELSETKIRSMLNKITSNEQIADWFSSKWKVFNECSIITKDENGNLAQYRPDRIMTNQDETIIVDFKFGRPRKEYQSQVRNYMKLLLEMGYKNISGFLWFVYTNEIVKVEHL